MLGLAALVLATASAVSAPSLATAAPWWERITFTLGNDGSQHACRFESSITGASSCTDDGKPAAAIPAGSASVSFTKITIERRFNPGSEPDQISLHSGDTLLGGQIMALAFDEAGSVSSCKVVGESGELARGYGCAEIRTERFEASAGQARGTERQGFMTVIVYGHKEILA